MLLFWALTLLYIGLYPLNISWIDCLWSRDLIPTLQFLWLPKRYSRLYYELWRLLTAYRDTSIEIPICPYARISRYYDSYVLSSVLEPLICVDLSRYLPHHPRKTSILKQQRNLLGYVPIFHFITNSWPSPRITVVANAILYRLTMPSNGVLGSSSPSAIT